MPNRSQIAIWVARGDAFAASYARARDAAAHLLCSELIDLCDNAAGDYVTDEDGRRRFDGENVQRSKLKIDTRKWVISKLIPQYADRISADVTSKVTIEDKTMTDVDYARNVIHLLGTVNLVSPCGTKLVGGLKYSDLITPNKELTLKAEQEDTSPPTSRERLEFLRPKEPPTDIEPEPPTGFAEYQRQWKSGKLK